MATGRASRCAALAALATLAALAALASLLNPFQPLPPPPARCSPRRPPPLLLPRHLGPASPRIAVGSGRGRARARRVRTAGSRQAGGSFVACSLTVSLPCVLTGRRLLRGLLCDARGDHRDHGPHAPLLLRRRLERARPQAAAGQARPQDGAARGRVLCAALPARRLGDGRRRLPAPGTPRRTHARTLPTAPPPRRSRRSRHARHARCGR